MKDEGRYTPAEARESKEIVEVGFDEGVEQILDKVDQIDMRVNLPRLVFGLHLEKCMILM